MKIKTTEKSVKLIELENTIVIEMGRTMKKPQIKEEFEKMFNVKVIGINTAIKDNKKIAYLKLAKENPAIDIATKIGLI